MTKEIQILYIDDDIELSALVEEYLAGKEMKVKLLHSPSEVIPNLQSGGYDLCLMDVKMPEKDGFTLAEEMRTANLNIPFIFLTGQTRKEDRIRGLKLGASDFISKPFSLEELYLRILNIFRRVEQGGATTQSVFELGQMKFHSDLGELHHSGNVINLSSTESRVLRCFCHKMNAIVSRKEILEEVWGEDDYYKGLSLNVYITRLRKRFTGEPAVSILNEHGRGYKMVVKN